MNITDPDFPVLHGEEMEEFVRDLPADESFTEEERARVIELFSQGEKVETPTVEKTARRPRPVKRVAAPKTKAKSKVSA